MTCQVFGLLLQKRTVVARRAAAGKGKFSTNLFFFRLRSFDSPAPQRNPHLLSLCHQLVPHPLLCCWQSHAVTSHPPPVGPSVGPGWSGAPPLCRAQNAGQRHCPSWLYNVSSAMMAPLRLRGGPPSHSKAAGRAGRAQGPSRKGQQCFCNTLGDQTYLMVKGLVPNLTARASDGAVTLPCDPVPAPGLGGGGSSAPLTR